MTTTQNATTGSSADAEIEAQKKNYLMARDSAAAERLNWQHGVLQVLNGNELIHRSIDVPTLVQKPVTKPKSKRLSFLNGFSKSSAAPPAPALKIAEVAAGTGLFAAQVKKKLVEDGYTNVEVDAFDLAHNHSIPDLVDTSINYVVHNMIKPWPVEYHNKYDYVHVRFMSGSLQKEEWEPAIVNCIQIVRPGGYFQWEEIDCNDLGLTTPTDASSRVLNCFHAAYNNSGKDGYGATTVGRLFKEQGLEDVSTNLIDTRTRPEMAADIDELFVWAAIETMEALLKNGVEVQGVASLEEAQRLSKTLRQELKENKVHFYFDFATMLGRKPLGAATSSSAGAVAKHLKKDSCVIC